MTKLEELEAAYEAATPDEWSEFDTYDATFHNEPSGRVEEVTEIQSREAGMTPAYVTNQPDLRFIVLAHNLMPTLLEAVEKLEYLNSLCSDYNEEYWATRICREVQALLEKLR